MNPFEFVDPVAPEDLIDRQNEAARLLRFALEGRNARVLAPRRYGKTSLLRRVLSDAEREGATAVYVDLFGVLTVHDVAQRIERAYVDQLRGPVGRWFEGVRRTLRPTLQAGGGPVPASVQVSADPGQVPLLERLALPRRVHERTAAPVVVAFDEFPDVLRAGDNLDAVMRSELQHHGGAVAYVFAGSHVGMMRELFSSRRRAFFGQASPVDLGPLPPDAVVAFVTDRFAATGRDPGRALGALLDLAEGHPQRTMLLAHALWERTPAGGTAEPEDAIAALDRVMRVEIADELEGTWIRMAPAQQRVLVGIAENASALYGRETARRTGAGRGGSVKAAVAALADAGEIVEATGAATGYRLVDPLLARWVAAGRTWPPRG